MFKVKERIMSIFKKFNIYKVGITDAELYNTMTGSDYKSIIVALFPYYFGEDEKSNISMYTYGKDYHRVIRGILEKVCSELGLKEYAVHTDIGPNIERSLALDAGLCFQGRNALCINDEYGSYFFIGYIATGEELEVDKPLDKSCLNCNKCVEACPGGALGDGFYEEKCLSAITQKKGELTNWEKGLIKSNGYAFGCDICQKVCPHNKNVKKSEINDFVTDIITKLELSEISKMSNREFMKEYKDRSFSWRGKGVVERNLKILEKNKAEIQ